jgi:hypothetical protein
MLSSFLLQLLNSLYAVLEEATNSFIGREHVSAMARLLGYKGVGMIGDELLKALFNQAS